MKTHLQSVFFLVTLLFISCSKDGDSNDIPDQNIGLDTYEWIIPTSEITGSDHAFPFAEYPLLSPVSDVQGLKDDDVVVLVSFKEEIRVYPYKFISPFEVVNDEMDGLEYAVTYCPVTESGFCADNTGSNHTFSLIASGFRFKENLVSLDAKSNSYWSQMLMKCVKGKFENQFQKTLPMVETNWKIVQTYFPEARVFTTGSIAEKGAVTTKKVEDDIGIDERVLGILEISGIEDTGARIFRKSDFNSGITLYQKLISSKNSIIIGSVDFDFMVSFTDDQGTSFTPIQNAFPIIMKDNSGSEWSVFGIAQNGPRKGEQLSVTQSYIASWWAWKEFYNDFTFNE